MHPEAYAGLKKMLDESGLDLNDQYRALDLGGRNVNGSIRNLLPHAQWTGLDIVDGPGVDIVRDATIDWFYGHADSETNRVSRFDIIVSTEMFEHVKDWRDVIRTCTQMLDSSGEEMIFFTCASIGRRPHGASGEWDPPPGEWYQNVSKDDMEDRLSKYFAHYEVTYNPNPGDIYGWAQCVKVQSIHRIMALDSCQDAIMPWTIATGSSECSSDEPFAVVNEANGSLEGCHTTEESAQEQIAALNAAENTNEELVIESDDVELIDDESDVEEPNTYVASDGTWSSILTVEGIESGDGRMFTEGALSWDTLPLPLMWQPAMTSGHDGAVLVGQINEIVRDNAFIRARGVFDLGGAEGSNAQEAHRLVEAGILRGVSVDVDSVKDNDIEFIFDDDIAAESDEDVDMLNMLFGNPSLMKINKGRIRGATLTPMPAFVEAEFALGEHLFMMDHFEDPSVSVHDTPIDADAAWNSVVEAANIPQNIAMTVALSAFAYVDNKTERHGIIPKTDCDFLHHSVDKYGIAGPANITACIAGIHKLNTNPAYSQLSDETRKGVYAHLSAHVLEANLVPNPLEPKKPLTAAAHVLTIHDVPPSEWFNEPKDVPMHGALTVTDEGRVYGLLAPKNINHRSFPGQSVQVPSKNVDYSLFMGGETIVSGGGRIVTGVITMDCGHANIGYDSSASMDHYDNSCSAVANVRIGENAQGTWVAGSVVPWISPEQIVKMMSCRLSGDWRPHSQFRGMFEFCGALLVPVPGFPMARKESSVTVHDGVLVASSVPVELIRTVDIKPIQRPSNIGIRAAAQVIAASVGRDIKTRKTELMKMVHGG